MIKISIGTDTLKDLLKIPEDKTEFAETWIHIVTNGFIFNEFVLKLKEMTQSYKVKINGFGDEQTIKIIKNQYDDYGILIKHMKYETTSFDYLQRLTEFVIDAGKLDLKEMYKKNNEFLDVLVPMQFMQWLLIQSKKRKIEYIETEKKENKETIKKTTKKTSKSNNQEYSLLDCIKIYQKKLNGDKRSYERHMEGWDVRGFWRHLKSGKVTWVAPYPKGENRNKTERNYKI
jgi:hypothetical protein